MREFRQGHGLRLPNTPGYSNCFAALNSTRRREVIGDVNLAWVAVANLTLHTRLAQTPNWPPISASLRTAIGTKMVEAAGVEPASLANLPAATTCLVRREFSTGRLRPDTESHSLARMVRDSIWHAQTPRRI